MHENFWHNKLFHNKLLDKTFCSFLKKADFKCRQCSSCCRHFPGVVYLSKEDFNKISKYLKINPNQLLNDFCRGIEKNGKLVVGLKEKVNYDCIFWSESCLIYPARPVQCITYPFWPSIVEFEERWKEEAEYCKGINKKGKLSLKQKIKYYLAEKNVEYMEYPAT